MPPCVSLLPPRAQQQLCAVAPPPRDWWEERGAQVGHASHRVWFIGPFAACLRCGAYMSRELHRAYRLHLECRGAPPNPSAELRLRRLRQGRHPLGDFWIEWPRLSAAEQVGNTGSMAGAATPLEGTGPPEDAFFPQREEEAAALIQVEASRDVSASKRRRTEGPYPPRPILSQGGSKRPAATRAAEESPAPPRKRLRCKTPPHLTYSGWQRAEAARRAEERSAVPFVADIAACYGRSFCATRDKAVPSGHGVSARGRFVSDIAALYGRSFRPPLTSSHSVDSGNGDDARGTNSERVSAQVRAAPLVAGRPKRPFIADIAAYYGRSFRTSHSAGCRSIDAGGLTVQLPAKNRGVQGFNPRQAAMGGSLSVATSAADRAPQRGAGVVGPCPRQHTAQYPLPEWDDVVGLSLGIQEGC